MKVRTANQIVTDIVVRLPKKVIINLLQVVEQHPDVLHKRLQSSAITTCSEYFNDDGTLKQEFYDMGEDE